MGVFFGRPTGPEIWVETFFDFTNLPQGRVIAPGRSPELELHTHRRGPTNDLLFRTENSVATHFRRRIGRSSSGGNQSPAKRLTHDEGYPPFFVLDRQGSIATPKCLLHVQR